MAANKIHRFPLTRIATIDIGALGIKRHRVYAFMEVDVTESRKKIREYRKSRGKVSFNAWLIRTISHTVKEYGQVAAFRKGKRKLVIFDDVSVSVAVEKEFNGEKIVVPLLLEKVNKLDFDAIESRLHKMRNEVADEKTMVLQRKTRKLERVYYLLPGFMRRLIWTVLLRYPDTAFNRMGNVAVTSLGTAGKLNGWFVPVSVHPLCFGIGAVIKKPVVVNDKIMIREILNYTLVADHDVVDGAPLARFVKSFSQNLENGIFL